MLVGVCLRCTEDADLFTFCPPGPPECMKDSMRSSSYIERESILANNELLFAGVTGSLIRFLCPLLDVNVLFTGVYVHPHSFG